MKKMFFPVLLTAVTVIACKKSASSDNGGTGTGATVTFTNSEVIDKRVILTSTTDTLYPFANSVLDITVQAKSSVTRTDIPAGKRKLVVLTNCPVTQPVNVSCTGVVYRTSEYIAARTYAELLQ